MLVSMEKQLTFNDHRSTRGRGGPRRGAGRPRGKRPRVMHRRRERVPSGAPVHVTLRVRRGLPRLRQRRGIDQLRRTFARGCERGAFRLVHYSVQNDHAHLIVEASGKKALECGMKSIGARFARAINRAFARSGPVLDGRYHAVILRSPTQVQRTLRYVLLNARKHGVHLDGIDPASSGRWFSGWKGGSGRVFDPGDRREVAPARSWLLRKGWRRIGLIDVEAVP